MAERRVERERGRARERDRVHREQQLALVDRVGERAPDEREDEQWPELHQAEKPHRE